MDLVEFKDLPDTSTPLNAKNLNNNSNALKPAYARMSTSVKNVSYVSGQEATIEGWSTTYITYGGFECDPTNNRIKIPAGTAKTIRVGGLICGYGNFSGRIEIDDVDYNRLQTTSILVHQSIGSGYFSVNLPTAILRIDDTIDNYLVLKGAGYNVAFELNAGFGEGSSYMMVEKIT